MAGLHVNFSAEEAAAESFDPEPLPSGKYPVTITEGTMEESNSEKHKGKSYWHLTFTVDEGHPNANRKFWGNIMLFEGALYSLAQFDKATDERWKIVSTGNIPAIDDIIGTQLVVRVVKQRNSYKEAQMLEAGERSENDPPIFKNEVKGYLSAATTATSTASRPTSKLP